MKNGLERGKYNQIANYAFMQSEINIKVGSKSPAEYFRIVQSQMQFNDHHLTGISTEKELQDNLEMNCVSGSIVNLSVQHYNDFLYERRQLMASKIKHYYFSL